MTAKRPTRKRKADRLLHANVGKTDLQLDYAVGPLDRLAQQMDVKWGIDRLPELVATETATRYGTAMAQLHEAFDAGDVERTAHKAAVCMKGLHAMDAEAEAAGQPKAQGNYREYHLGDFKFALIEDDREWQTLKANRPDLVFFTMREAALALKAFCEVSPIMDAKTIFPGATIKELPAMGKSRESLDDPINFF